MNSYTAQKISLALGTLLSLLCLPTLALGSTGSAQCVHPLEGGTCFAAFSLVSVSYTLIASAYAWGGLMILSPAFEKTTFRLMILLTPAVAWTLSMVAFSLGGALGWLTYPHDASPFFFMDWFVAIFLLVGQTCFVFGAWRRASTASVAAA